MIIALASPTIASSLDEGLDKVERLLSEAATQGAQIVCFPEAYLPGLRGADFDVLPFEQRDFERGAGRSRLARRYQTALILGTERPTEAGRLNVALVFDAAGKMLGMQTKNQVAPEEDGFYVPGNQRQLFELGEVKFGVAICHEGFRYPETVRWAAARGASIVFHPHQTGSDRQGMHLTEWGAAGAPYYEKAMLMRSIENGIYFASVNYALQFQESATSLIDPSGNCQAYLPYGVQGLLVQNVDLDKAAGLYAARYAPERFQEVVSEWHSSIVPALVETAAPRFVIEALLPTDWEQVRRIYLAGLATGQASFETEAPTWEQWNEARLAHSRFVARRNGQVIAWAALSPISKRPCYAGVAEASVYVAADARGGHVGKALLEKLIAESQRHGVWSLHGATFPENTASIRLQLSCGFRIVGRRERIAQRLGVWRDTIVTERRSKTVGTENQTEQL